MAKADLTAQRLRELLHYDPVTGMFTWRVKRNGANGGVRPGDTAGKTNRAGYVYIGIDRKVYLAHRLAVLHVTGEWPAEDVDHIDGSPSNNAMTNLRAVTHAINMQNRRRPTKGNKAGLLGVHYIPSERKWAADITADGKCPRIGRFPTAEAAYAAYLKMKRAIHGGCTI